MSDNWFSGRSGSDEGDAGWLAKLRDENVQHSGSVSLLRRRLTEALERTRRAEAQAAAAMAEARLYRRRFEDAIASR